MDYINRDPGELTTDYKQQLTHLTITPRIKDIRKQYRNRTKAYIRNA